MAKTTNVSGTVKRPKVKRLGIHTKLKQSSSKTSKNYVKPYIS